MLLAACPKCQESVLVPFGVTASAQVRCPLCQEEYVLADVLEQLPPSLIVVDGAEVVALAHAGSGAASAESGISISSDRSDSDSALRAFIGEKGASTGVAEGGGKQPAFDYTERSTPRAVTPSRPGIAERPRKRQRSPLFHVVGIVLGGLAAAPLAQLILWWLPGSWQRDPINLGPSVGRYVPWIVPANLRTGAPVEENQDGATDKSPAPSAGNTDSRDTAGGDKKPNRLAGQLANGSSGGNDKQPGGLADASRPFQRGAGNGADGATNSGVNQGADVDFPLSGLGSDTDPPRDADHRPGAANTYPLRGGPTTRTADLERALADTEAAWKRLSEAADPTADQERESRMALYRSLSRLGDVVTHVDHNDAGIEDQVEQIRSLLYDVGRDRTTFAFLGSTAADWIDDHDRPSAGVVLAGTVRQQRQPGELYEVQIELAGDTDEPRIVNVLGWIDPKMAQLRGDRVIVVGAFVSDPQANLSGYTGSEKEVICGGFGVLVLPR
jgi:hypothetical protein